MSAFVPAMVTPSLLVWARDEAGYALEEAAAKAKVPVEKLRSWETTPEDQPSIRQAERLAKLYDRTLSFLSLPTPPALPPLCTEYRHLPGVKPGGEPPALRGAVRRLVHRRRIALQLLGEFGEEPPSFDLTLHLHEDAESAGRKLRTALGVTIEQQFDWASEYVAFRVWRAAVEGLGVLVCQFPGKEVAQTRGLGILHFPLPVIGISSRELPLAKPFTLLHELAHLALSSGQEEKPASEEKRRDAEWLKVERYCEAVASAVLMPGETILKDPFVLSQQKSGEWTPEGMRKVSKRYRVSPTAAATRLLWLRVITPNKYAAWKADWAGWCQQHPDKGGGGIATHAEKAVTRAGPFFTSLVLGALGTDRITSADASNFLDVGYDHVEVLRKGWMNAPRSLAGIGKE